MCAVKGMKYKLELGIFGQQIHLAESRMNRAHRGKRDNKIGGVVS